MAVTYISCAIKRHEGMFLMTAFVVFPHVAFIDILKLITSDSHRLENPSRQSPCI